MSVALFARYPISRQTLVVLVDAAAITVALPLALVLRENRLPAGDRLAELWASLPLLALAAVTASLLLGSYRAVWRYMGIAEILRLAQLALLAILLFYLGQFVVDRLEHLPRSAPPIHFLVAMFLLIGARILYGEWCRRGHGRAGGPTRRPLLLVGSGDGAALFIQMLQHQPDRQYDIAGIICDQVARHRSIAGVPVLGGLADFDAVLATLRVQGMTPDRVVVTRPHHELGRDAVYHIMSRADAQGIAVEQLPDLMRFRADTPVAPRAADHRRHDGRAQAADHADARLGDVRQRTPPLPGTAYSAAWSAPPPISATPTPPGKRVGIENANGRIRRWLPRTADLDAMTEADIQEIAMTLNLTPRKCLGFRSPVEAFLAELGNNVDISFHRHVALRT
ncbi:MAG: hypothetical protein R3D28_07780 [Geminicoccaceae bacterium]